MFDIYRAQSRTTDVFRIRIEYERFKDPDAYLVPDKKVFYSLKFGRSDSDLDYFTCLGPFFAAIIFGSTVFCCMTSVTRSM